jgi:hypothetical protein
MTLMKPKRIIRSFELSPNLLSLLNGATKSTGRTRSDLINQALHEHLGPMVRRIMVDMEKDGKKFMAEWESRNDHPAK